MARTRTARRTNNKSSEDAAFQLRNAEDAGHARESQVHIIDKNKGIICDTESRGYKTPNGRSIEELVVNAPGGVVPLWAKDTILRWRFRESSMHFFQNPTAAKTGIRNLIAKVLVAWGDAAPVRFTQSDDSWDFEIVMRQSDSCDINGCVLASAFFPDTGRHQLRLYPQMFAQNEDDRVRTLEHEFGHIFGLRHFFAQISELAAPSEIFGTHKPFTIMNYGDQSHLTEDDKSDLKRLYESAWNGELTSINGTPIRFVKPFHTLGEQSDISVAAAQVPSVLSSMRRAAFRSHFGMLTT